MLDQSHLCQYCGAKNRRSARFCGRCGEPLLAFTTIAPDDPPRSGDHEASPITGELAPGSAVDPNGRYRIVRLLGKGGFGEAYLTHDTVLGRSCVTKRLTMRPQWSSRMIAATRERFAHEARLLISLNTPGHPAIPEIYDYFPEQAALVMKYVAGVSFAELLAGRPDGIGERAALTAVHAVCDALVYIHQRRPEPVIHRDIKPANLMRDPDQRVWLIDFGLAQAVGITSTSDTPDGIEVIGTPAYMAPEQWLGQAGPPSDIYALGATLWSLLTGQRLPNERGLRTRFDAQQHRSLRPELARLVSATLAEEAADRPDARTLRTEIDALMRDSRAFISPPPPSAPPHPRLIGRHAELATLRQQLHERRYVCISGIAGIGKTALAQTLAYQGIEADRVFWYTFRAGQQATTLIWQLAGFLSWQGLGDLWRIVNSAEAGTRPPPEALIAYAVQLLHKRRVRCCLDDIHHVEADPIFQQLVLGLREAPEDSRCELILTSRQVPQLLAYEATTPLDGLSPAATEQLLAEQQIQLTGEMPALLQQQTGGNPQLLLMAIDVIRHTPDPSRLVRQLTDAEQIDRYILGEVDRHLDDQERALLHALAVLFDASGRREAIEQILGRGGLRRTLDRLNRRHLVQIRDTSQEPIYALHTIIRTFYYADLSTPERRALHLRAAAYYAELDQLQAARHYQAAGHSPAAATLVLGNLWGPLSQGRGGELAALLDQIPAAALTPTDQVALHTHRGELATYANRGELADAHYGAALQALGQLPEGPARQIAYARVCRGQGERLEQAQPAEALEWLRRGEAAVADHNPQELAAIQLRIGSVLIGRGAYGAAKEILGRCLQQLPATAEQLRASALLKLGTIDCAQGRSAEGQARYREALAIYERHHNHWAIIGIRHNLAIELEIGGDWAEAERAYLEALTLAEQLGNRSRRAHLELSLGILKTNQGDFDAAQDYLAGGARLAETLNLNELSVAYRSSLADLALRQGDLAQAEQLLIATEQDARNLDSQYQEPEIQRSWALLHLQRGRWDPAYERAARAVTLAHELEEPIAEGVSLRVLGLVLGSHDAHAAAAHFARSLELLAGQDPYETARTRATWGRLLLDQGDTTGAKALIEAARTTFARLGARADLEGLDPIAYK